MIVLIVQAFAGGGLFPRIPDIQAGLGLSAGDLGWTLLGQPIGALTSYVIASFLIERVGTKRLLSICIPLISVMTLLIALASRPAIAFVAMFAYGLSFALANVAMNVEADRVEASCGERVMVRCHGMWGSGFLAASIVGAAARGAALVPAMHLGLVLPLVLAVAVLLI